MLLVSLQGVQGPTVFLFLQNRPIMKPIANVKHDLIGVREQRMIKSSCILSSNAQHVAATPTQIKALSFLPQPNNQEPNIWVMLIGIGYQKRVPLLAKHM